MSGIDGEELFITAVPYIFLYYNNLFVLLIYYKLQASTFVFVLQMAM